MNPNPFVRSFEIFNRSMVASSRPRGLSIENKGSGSADLFIYDSIGADSWTGEGISAKSVADALDQAKGIKTLNVFINSPGGSIFEGKAIYNQLMRFDARKVVTVDGIAASAASFIAMAGDRIITSQGATWMIHNGMGGAYGFAKDLRAVADVLDMESANIVGIYAKRTGQTTADLQAWMDSETWMDAETAKARGFTDEIAADEKPDIEPRKAAASTPTLVSTIDSTRRVAATLATMKREITLSKYRVTAGRAAGRAGPDHATTK